MAKINIDTIRGQIGNLGHNYEADQSKYDMKVLKISEIMDNDFNTESFRLQTPEEYQELKEGIKQVGLITPITVVQLVGYGLYKYKVISGYHRKKAMLELGFDEIPAYIINLPDENDQKLALIQANIVQRKLNSQEYAKLIAQSAEILKQKNALLKQGEKINVNNTIADTFSMSVAQVKKLNKLNELIPELQDMIAAGTLPTSKGYSLALLPSDTQQILFEALQDNIAAVRQDLLKEFKEKTNEEISKAVEAVKVEEARKAALNSDKAKIEDLKSQIVKSDNYITKLKNDLDLAKSYKPRELEQLKESLALAEANNKKYLHQLSVMQQSIIDAQVDENPSLFKYLTEDRRIRLNKEEEKVVELLESLGARSVKVIVNIIDKAYSTL